MAGDDESTTRSDRKLQAWLQDRIVRLELFRYTVNSLAARIDAIDQEAISLGKELHREDERMELREEWRQTSEELHLRCPDLPYPLLSVQDQLDTYAQALIEVNERLAAKHQPAHPSLRDLYTTKEEGRQSRQTHPERDDEPQQNKSR
jgi:hypothetical protein